MALLVAACLAVAIFSHTGLCALNPALLSAATFTCVDMNPMCPNYKQFCQVNSNVQRICPQTCGRCSSGCMDMNPYCPNYVAYCRMDPRVQRICPKTCNLCGAPTSPPRPPRTGPPPLPASCGNPAVQSGRVIAGTTAVPHSWPWQILMIIGGQPGCGGSIISANTVVTAAHCLGRYASNPGMFSVRVGVHNRNQQESTAVEHRVRRVIVHSGWNPNTFDNDIALLELASPIQFNKYVSPVCLPKADPPVGSQCYITGWGKTRPGPYSPMNDVLQQAVLPVASQDVCYRYNFPTTRKHLTDAMICGGDGGQSRKSGCQGDSGGPYVCNIGGRWELHGAVSYGSSVCDSRQTYTVFARVAHFRQWIEDNMS